jgi:hypothetical protein
MGNKGMARAKLGVRVYEQFIMVINLVNEGVIRHKTDYLDLSHGLKKNFGLSFNQGYMTTV